MKARYIRVSSPTQNNARQLAKAYPDEKLFIDVCSGAIPFGQREQAKKLLFESVMGNINYISVSSIDRLGRNMIDILTTIEVFNKNKTILKVDNLGIESLVNGEPSDSFRLIISVMSSVSEMERKAIRSRQKEGIAIAVLEKKYKGRVKGSGMTDDEVLKKYSNVVKELKLGVNSVRKIATLCGVGTDTVMKVKKVLNNKG